MDRDKEETGITKAEIVPGFSEETGYYFKHEGLVSKKVTYFIIKTNVSKIILTHPTEQ